MGKTWFTIKIAGPAGMGIKSGGSLISSYFQKLGLYFTDYSEYPSLVRGGHNTYQTSLSQKPIFSVHQKVDIFFSLKPDHFLPHQDEFSKDSLVFSDQDIKTTKFKSQKLPLNQFQTQLNSPLIGNIVCFGVLVFLFDTDIALAKKLIKQTYQNKANLNIKAFDVAIDYASKNYQAIKKRLKNKLPKPVKQKVDNQTSYDGNQAFAYGFYKAGGNFYAAYPMTPSTGALHLLAQKAKDWHMTVIHPEDEIAVASLASGASYAGAVSAVGTSGGGFALMNETISFNGIAELGVLYYLVSRPGPATGMPTWTSQADLLYAIFSGHGDFPKIVIAPGDQQESFHLAQNATHLSQQLQTPVIFLSDKHIAESNSSLPDFDKLPFNKYQENIVTNPSKDFKRYSLATQTGISLRTIPGIKSGQFLANSYEHDQAGFSTEDSATAIKMADKRAKKIATAKRLAPPPKLFDFGGTNLIISWGSTKGAILESFNLGLKNYDYLQIKTVWPLSDKIASISKNYSKIIVIENNQFGHLNLLLKTLGVKTSRFIKKYDGRPFFPEEIIKFLKIENCKLKISVRALLLPGVPAVITF